MDIESATGRLAWVHGLLVMAGVALLALGFAAMLSSGG